MYLSLIITIVIALLLSFLIFKLLSKTFKFLVFLLVFAIIFGVLYFGYDTLTSKVKDVGSEALKDNIISLSACTSNSDCAFVTSASDCNLVANSCNNIRDSSKFVKPNSKTKCSIDSVIINADVKCFCKKTSSGSSCQKL